MLALRHREIETYKFRFILHITLRYYSSAYADPSSFVMNVYHNVNGYWKTNHIVTLSLFHFIGPATY